MSWVWPTQREDGSALPTSEVDSFEIYYYPVGQQGSGVSVTVEALDGDSLVSDYMIAGLGEGSYEVAIAAVDSDGDVSSFTDPVSIAIN